MIGNLFRTLFSVTGLLLVVYVIIGIAINTAAPHFPSTSTANLDGGLLHSWIQYIISIFFWPLSFWHPEFTVGKWTP